MKGFSDLHWLHNISPSSVLHLVPLPLTVSLFLRLGFLPYSDGVNSSSEMSLTVCHTAQCYIPEDSHHCDNLKSPENCQLSQSCACFSYPRPFSVQKIPRSNLILLVVDTLCPCGSKQLSITPQEVVYESMQGVAVTTQCRIKPQEVMYRRRPPKCMNYHPEVSPKAFNIDPV